MLLIWEVKTYIASSAIDSSVVHVVSVEELMALGKSLVNKALALNPVGS